MALAPGRKFGNGPGIGLACVRVADVGGKEGDEPFGGFGCRSEERGDSYRAFEAFRS